MNTLPQLIGIHGLAGAGKDTLALHLQLAHGYALRALADPLRAILSARFGWSPNQWADRGWKEQFHWSNNCGPFSPRDWMQWTGDVLREMAGDDILVRRAFKDWDQQPGLLVVTDIRINEEAQAVIDRGGLVLKLIRNVVPVRAHRTENGIHNDLVHGTLVNNGTIGEMFESADLLLRRLWAERSEQVELDLGDSR